MQISPLELGIYLSKQVLIGIRLITYLFMKYETKLIATLNFDADTFMWI